MKKLLFKAAALSALAVATLGAAAPALADWDHDRDGWRDREWREHQWRENQWRGHEWRERAEWRERQAWREHEWREHHRGWYGYGPYGRGYYDGPAYGRGYREPGVELRIHSGW
jgi:hypothetical protein